MPRGRSSPASFALKEDAHGYFLLLRRLIRRYGVPTAVYTDRHGLFHRDPRTPLSLAEQLQGRPESTQVGRALQELGIRWIPARSPQAKGRIERLFGTFQDRLVVELRLAHAATMAQAQRILDRFLPRYNTRFAHAPAHPEPAWRPAPPDLERICCCKYQRTVAKDNTVTLGSRHLQLLPGPNGRSFAGVRVDVSAPLTGPLAVSYRGQRLVTKPLLPGQQPSQRPKDRSRKGEPDPDTPLPTHATQSPRKGHTPPADHRWRWGYAARARAKQLQIQAVTFSQIR